MPKPWWNQCSYIRSRLRLLSFLELTDHLRRVWGDLRLNMLQEWGAIVGFIANRVAAKFLYPPILSNVESDCPLKVGGRRAKLDFRTSVQKKALAVAAKAFRSVLSVC